LIRGLSVQSPHEADNTYYVRLTNHKRQQISLLFFNGAAKLFLNVPLALLKYAYPVEPGVSFDRAPV
jgi:hypothetical protein